MIEEPRARPPLFVKTVLTFLAPLLLSIVVLGFFSVKNTQSYVLENTHRINSNILGQTRDIVDSMMDELNIITMNFSLNTKAQYSLRRILQKDFLEYEDLKELEIIQNMLSISHYSRAYMQSIYVYFNNSKDRFITSEMVITSLDAFPDRSWHRSYLAASSARNSWTELRTIRRSGMSTREVSVLTFYKLIYNSTAGGYNGLVVFNVYADYVRGALNALETFEDMSIFVLDDSNKLLVHNNGQHDFLLPYILTLPPDVTEVKRDGRVYTVARSGSKYGLTYVSVVPNRTLYRLSDYQFKLYIIYILASLTIGIALSFYLARKSNNQIRTIIDIIESAKRGRLENPERFATVRNSYQYILYNVINTFLEKDYLKIQLSERQYRSRVDELTALQSQINPHFLFNTLQTINMNAMSLGGVSNEGSDMISHLSLILRYSLSDPGVIVSLEEEISHAKSYIAVQSMRYKDIIAVLWDYDEEILRYGTIKLLFQPFLENSIYHGIKERGGPGEIAIGITAGSDTLSITISDTGIGIPAGRLGEIRRKLEETDEHFEHIGLFNTNRRIRLTFGDDYGIAIESEEGVGTKVRVTLPKIAL